MASDEVPNPIPMKTRGQIYVASEVIGALVMVVTAILVVVGLDEWVAVASAVGGAASLLAGRLARNNLSDNTQKWGENNG